MHWIAEKWRGGKVTGQIYLIFVAVLRIPWRSWLKNATLEWRICCASLFRVRFTFSSNCIIIGSRLFIALLLSDAFFEICYLERNKAEYGLLVFLSFFFCFVLFYFNFLKFVKNFLFLELYTLNHLRVQQHLQWFKSKCSQLLPINCLFYAN